VPKLQEGDVILYKFHPSQGIELKKLRPSIVINEKIQKIDQRFTLIVPLSSKRKNAGCIRLSKSKYSFLDKTSYVLHWYVRAVDVNRLTIIGKLEKTDLLEIKKQLSLLFQS
jgi:mRNA-degrading endonuclease toxin of MazEF toxin-antitoxin module